MAREMNANVLPESLIEACGNDGDVLGWEGEMNTNDCCA